MPSLRRAGRVVAVTTIGTLLLVAGTIMLVTPGPGLLTIAAGLAVLGREFGWARRLLDRSKEAIVSRLGRRDARKVERLNPEIALLADEDADDLGEAARTVA